MGQLRDKMIEDLTLKNLKPATHRAYLRCARDFAAHFRRSPAEMGEAEVRQFLLVMLEERKVKAATHQMYVAALKFLYGTTLKRPEVMADIAWPKVPKSKPSILSGTEMEAFLAAIEAPKYRAILMTAYASGLRISEICHLRIADIDSKRKVIFVRDGKGGKDRYVMLGERLLLELRRYYKAERPTGPYLFPGKNGALTSDAVRHMVHKVCKKSGIKKRVTPHALRHAFATHLLEAGGDVRTLQLLLGHSSLRSTIRYTHLSTRSIGALVSPFDLLGTKAGEALG